MMRAAQFATMMPRLPAHCAAMFGCGDACGRIYWRPANYILHKTGALPMSAQSERLRAPQRFPALEGMRGAPGTPKPS